MAKYQEIAKVVSQECIADGIYSMWIAAEKIARETKAGQFVSLYSKDGAHLLPRPISICQVDADAGKLRLVYRVAGFGTEEFSGYTTGDTVSILGPLGNGFPLSGQPALLIGGGIGVPPLLEAAKQLREKGLAKEQVVAVLGYRNAQMFLKEDFEQYATVLVATEDGSVGTKGNVLDALAEHSQQVQQAEVIYSCGPTPMLRALKAYADQQKITCYISMEERMACGIGACLACVCKSTEVDDHSHVNNKRICKDGPVFLTTEVEL